MVWVKLFSALFGSIIFFSTTSLPSYADGSIEIFTLNAEINPTEDVFVTGFVNTETFYKPVTLEVYDPNGKLLFNPIVNFNEDGQFSWLFHPPLGKYEVAGTYRIIATHEDISKQDEIQFTVTNFESKVSEEIIPKSKNESSKTSEVFFESFEPKDTTSQIKEQKVSVTTGSSGADIFDAKKTEVFGGSYYAEYLIPIGLLTVVIPVILKIVKNNKKTKQMKSNF